MADKEIEGGWAEARPVREHHAAEQVAKEVFEYNAAEAERAVAAQLTDYQRGTPSTEPVSLGEMVRPMPGKIVVRVDTRSEITPQGLHIPYDQVRTIHESRPTQGQVVAVCTDDQDWESSGIVKVGDTVLFGKFTGTKVEYQPDRTKDKEVVIVMNEKDVLAILLSPSEARNIKVKS